METFRTILRNNRGERRAIQVFDHLGSSLTETIRPGDSVIVEAITPLATYARWEEVTWQPDGTVRLTPRPGFKEPDRGRWVLHCLNRDGKPLEYRQVGATRVCLPKGIPVLVTCPLTSELILQKSLTIRHREAKAKSEYPLAEGYVVPYDVVDDVLEPRSDSELDAIQRILDDMAKKDER
jgi:hypothetical protein